MRSLLGHGTVVPARAELEAGRTRQAIGVYDDLVARFGEATEPALREHVAKALFAHSDRRLKIVVSPGLGR